MKICNYIVVLTLLLSACSDDIERLDTDKLKNWEIGGIAEDYRVKLNDSLIIKPLILDENFDSTKFDYVWYMYDNGSLTAESTYDTLCQQRILNCKIDNKVIRALDTEHWLVFKMIDKETGVYYVRRAKLFASGIYGLGTFLLCQDGEKSKIHFIHRDTRKLVEDVCVVNEADLTNPTKIVFVNTLNAFLPKLKEVMIFCDNENGGAILDPTTFTQTKSFREKVNAEIDGVLTPRFHFQNGTQDYLIYNGYSCAKKMSSSVYDPFFAVISEPGNVDLAPMVWKILQYYDEEWYEYVNAGPIYYDQKNHRFLEHAIENRGYVREMKKGENSVFDCNHVGDNMELVCGGKLSGIGNGWALMRDSNTRKLYLLKFSTMIEFPIPGNKNSCSVTFTGTDKIELTATYAPHLAEASHISSVYNVEDGVFVYSTENKVYAFNLNLASSSNPINLETELISESDLNGLKISNLEYVSYEVENPDDSWSPFVEKEVRLYTFDPTLSEKKCGVIFYKIETLGGLHLSEIYRKSGISDKIIDVEEKYN